MLRYATDAKPLSSIRLPLLVRSPRMGLLNNFGSVSASTLFVVDVLHRDRHLDESWRKSLDEARVIFHLFRPPFGPILLKKSRSLSVGVTS